MEDIGDRECDIFGFYRNVRFIKLQDQKISSTKRRDKRRIKKWAKMAADFDRALTKKLPSRIYEGVPNQMRKELWLYLGLIWELLHKMNLENLRELKRDQGIFNIKNVLTPK